jgi:hypothetical protein
MANRVELAITKIAAQIALAKGLRKDLTSCEKAATINHEELVVFQDAQSKAHAAGILTLEEAQTVYITLGETPEHFNAQSLASRIAVQKLMSELLPVLQ